MNIRVHNHWEGRLASQRLKQRTKECSHPAWLLAHEGLTPPAQHQRTFHPRNTIAAFSLETSNSFSVCSDNCAGSAVENIFPLVNTQWTLLAVKRIDVLLHSFRNSHFRSIHYWQRTAYPGKKKSELSGQGAGGVQECLLDTVFNFQLEKSFLESCRIQLLDHAEFAWFNRVNILSRC